MNYIYDIVVNFNQEIHDFFEWEETDDIKEIRKIPLFKIDNKTYKDIINSNIKIEESFLKIIKDETEAHSGSKITFIKYASIFSDGEGAIGILFDKSGLSIKRTTFLFDELNSILEITKDKSSTLFSYDVISSLDSNYFMTRKDKTIIKFLCDEIDTNYKNKDYEKLEYLYYELMSETCSNYMTTYDTLKKEIKEYKNKRIEYLYDLIKLTHEKKQL